MIDNDKKLTYSTPRLVEFGSVRNLTGGSQTMNFDGAAFMALRP